MKRFLKLFLFVLVSSTFLPVCARAQEPEDVSQPAAGHSVEDILSELQEELAKGEHRGSPTPPPILNPEMVDDSVKMLMNDALRAHYEWRITSLEHRGKVFAWQLLSAKLIFFFVLLLVFAGICFSGVQFYKSIKAKPGEGQESSQDALTEIEISARGVKVTSPVLGVVILVISLVFFYLYLVHIFPIEELRSKLTVEEPLRGDGMELTP